MKRLVIAALAIAPALMLSGCGNHDPRNGQVTLNHSNCLLGDCWQLTEICKGTTLITRFSDGYDSDNSWSRETVDDPKCQGGAA